MDVPGAIEGLQAERGIRGGDETVSNKSVLLRSPTEGRGKRLYEKTCVKGGGFVVVKWEQWRDLLDHPLAVAARGAQREHRRQLQETSFGQEEYSARGFNAYSLC